MKVNPSLLVIIMAVLAICMLLYSLSQAATITKAGSVLFSSLSQRIDTGCAWDGNTANITVIGYYQTATANEYDLDELTPTIFPGQEFFILVFSSSDLTYGGLRLSYVNISYGEKSC